MNLSKPQQPNHRLPKSALIRKSGHYRAVYRQGKRFRGRHFSLIYINNDKDFNRLGISVHGVKLAVDRNRLKRLIREFFRLNRNFMPAGKDIVFAARSKFQPVNAAEINSLVSQAMHIARPTVTSSKEAGP